MDLVIPSDRLFLPKMLYLFLRPQLLLQEVGIPRAVLNFPLLIPVPQTRTVVSGWVFQVALLAAPVGCLRFALLFLVPFPTQFFMALFFLVWLTGTSAFALMLRSVLVFEQIGNGGLLP